MSMALICSWLLQVLNAVLMICRMRARISNASPNLFRKLSAKLSNAKAMRYSAADIKAMNFAAQSHFDDGRECRECHRSTALASNDDICKTCESLQDISADLVSKSVFAIVDDSCGNPRHRQLSLPFGANLVLYERNCYLKEKPEVRRVYTKDWDAGTNLATHIWMGDYTADTDGEGISSYAGSAIPWTAEKELSVLAYSVPMLIILVLHSLEASPRIRLQLAVRQH